MEKVSVRIFKNRTVKVLFVQQQKAKEIINSISVVEIKAEISSVEIDFNGNWEIADIFYGGEKMQFGGSMAGQLATMFENVYE